MAITINPADQTQRAQLQENYNYNGNNGGQVIAMSVPQSSIPLKIEIKKSPLQQLQDLATNCLALIGTIALGFVLVRGRNSHVPAVKETEAKTSNPPSKLPPTAQEIISGLHKDIEALYARLETEAQQITTITNQKTPTVEPISN